MVRTRLLAGALTIACWGAGYLGAGCGSPSTGLECPVTGAALDVDGPTLQPEWVYAHGCHDPESWTAEVEPANPTWTIELRRALDEFATLQVARMPDGVAAVWGSNLFQGRGELILVGSDGVELASRELGVSVDWTSFATTQDGHMIVASRPSSSVLQYRVLDPTGVDIWLRLLDVDFPVGPPALTLDEDGSLWVALGELTPSGTDFQVRMQQWAVTGAMLSEVVLPFEPGRGMARDGVGRFALIDYDLVALHEADGTPIGAISLANSDAFNAQVIGLAEGFVVGGSVDQRPTITRIDARAEIVWQRTLPRSDQYHSYVAGLAALPDGGVVAIGTESTIEVRWPESPIVERDQPFVIALDEDGEPTWGERLAVGGKGWAVTVGSQGEIYVSGLAQAHPDEVGLADMIGWLRRYDP